MLTRRDFLRFGALAATGAIPAVKLAGAPSLLPQAYFGVHPFIESNPKAVFIRRTHVAHETDEEGKRREGLALAREVFVPMERAGIPVSHRIILKPNAGGTENGLTDAHFYEGVVMALKEIGLRKLYFVEANNYPQWVHLGYVDINQRLGVLMNEPGRSPQQFRESWEMTWSTVPDGVVFKRIPHYAPVNEPDTWLLNIAKWKSHGMGLTLSVKNEQGSVVLPYCRFCSGWQMVTGVPEFMKPDIQPNAEPVIQKLFERHVKLHYDRYNSQATLGPMVMEIWAQKTCDHMSVMKTGLAMIEGISAAEGDGRQTLTNLVMFGKNKFHLDMIGLYLGGHEPGDINLFRIAKERGLTDTFNPWEVPVYEWVDGAAVPRKLTDFARTPLKTYYLQLPGEPRYHLVNEPFDYNRYKA
ncbi:MAG TPA: DUF362 domain-containing protein [Terriglobia bacterium]|nr:DUF362 domain-containing protein [Terriglobia bacterium]